MQDKIYIIGPIGSGKTTLAKKTSKIYGHPHFELDRIIHRKTKSGEYEVKTENEIYIAINKIINKPQFVIEDTGTILFFDIYDNIDIFVFLEPKTIIRKYRIIKRFLKRLINIEPQGFEENLPFIEKTKFVKSLLKTTASYNINDNPYSKKSLMKHLKDNNSKYIVLKTNKDIEAFLEENNNITKQKSHK